MLQIHKDLLLFDEHIKERLEFICKYANKKTDFYNGNNLHYIKPHILFMNLDRDESIVNRIKSSRQYNQSKI